MEPRRLHVCEDTPSGCSCTVVRECPFVVVRIGDEALTRSGYCMSLDATVRFEAEFCPWCGARITEVAK